MKKLYIEEAFNIAMGGDIKGAFEKLFSGYTTGVQSPAEFFQDLFDSLRKVLGIEQNY